MSTGASKCLFLYLLSVIVVCSSGTQVGFFYDARKSNSISSATETISFLRLNKVPPSQIRVLVADQAVLDSFSNTRVPVDLYLNKTQVENLKNNKPSAISLLKYVNINNIIVSSSRSNELPALLSTLKSIHTNVTVTLPLSFIENLNKKHQRNLHAILDFVSKARSFVIIEANIDGELCMGDQFVESVIKKATLATSTLLHNNVSMVLNIKTSAAPSAKEVSKFRGNIAMSLEKINQIMGKKIIGLFAEVSLVKEFHSSHRELLRKTQHDLVYPPTTTIYPTTPITNPVTTPSIVTVTPNPISSTPVPSTEPVNSPVPITNPVTTPVTNPVTPPSGANSQTLGGQGWCVAKSGATEAALQAALDYACGIGGADCSTIQQGGSCYNPNSLETHASYAFNSYYQKNPVQSSCDFGGVAMVTNANPSTGSCVFPSSSSPITTSPTPTTTSSSGATLPLSGSPPSELNTSNPAWGTAPVLGESPPSVNMSSTSMLQPLMGCIFLVTSINIILHR